MPAHPVQKNCEDCQVDLGLVDPRRRVCEDCGFLRHRKIGREFARKKRGITPPDSITCHQCGVEFDRRASVVKYCADCSPYRKDRTLPKCIDCGASSSQKGKRCKPCGIIRKRLRNKAYAKPKPLIDYKCSECAVEFQHADPTRVTCGGKECQASRVRKLGAEKYWKDPAAHNAQEAIDARRRRHTNPGARERASDAARARRAMVKGADADTIQFRIIVKRDPCFYCYRQSKTIEHIIPLSAWGENHWTNMAGACHHCNSSKKITPLIIWLAKKNGMAGWYVNPRCPMAKFIRRKYQSVDMERAA